MGIREVIFRGKRIDNGEWAEGYFYKWPCVSWKELSCVIVPVIGLENGIAEQAIVDPSTVGQSTGMTDKNGKKIFEGDIVETYNYSTLMEIRWNEKTASFELWRYDTWYGQLHTFNPIEVLGNVFDNSELLEGD